MAYHLINNYVPKTDMAAYSDPMFISIESINAWFLESLGCRVGWYFWPRFLGGCHTIQAIFVQSKLAIGRQ